jgi:hypothetical protein
MYSPCGTASCPGVLEPNQMSASAFENQGTGTHWQAGLELESYVEDKFLQPTNTRLQLVHSSLLPSG